MKVLMFTNYPLISTLIVRPDRKKGYVNLLGYSLFVAAFAAMLLLQRDSVTAFSIEETIRGALFSTESNTVGGDGSVSVRIPHAEDFYTWLNTNVLFSFKDPICGDGVCEGRESKSYAHHGCFSDCGAYTEANGEEHSLLNAVQVELHLKPSKLEMGYMDEVVTWNICTNHGG
jgi:hypothetical protein